MNLEVHNDAEAAAQAAAIFIAAKAREAIAARGRFIMAVSGGHTPWLMLRALADEDVPWEAVHLVQVDERVAPAGDPDRNLTHLLESLREIDSLRSAHIHAMPVEAPDLELAASQYATVLNQIAGSPAVLDLVHLGLGPDGHTASLVPGDPVLDVDDADVAIASVYQGRRRMTLTYPIINRARQVLWLVTGKDKAEIVGRLRNGDTSIPAGRVHRDRALILADLAAAGRDYSDLRKE
jgi:6-phosphogluconolactonase